MHEPDFNQLLKVLRRERPDRPTLFEFFLNPTLEQHLAAEEITDWTDILEINRNKIKAFRQAGYDYFTILGSDFGFPGPERHRRKSISQNEGSVIWDWESFAGYHWPNPDDFDYSRLQKQAEFLPEGMKFIVYGPGGVLENVVGLVGYDQLCYMLYEDPELVQEIFDEVGSRLVRYYEICTPYESVGALISNDDWGFNQQTMLKPADMRKYVFPWHKKIVETIHNSSKPAILHSCGNLEAVMDEIINGLKYDAKHSYEDKILPVEEAYTRYGSRIAILGGIDLDFICRATPEQVEARCRAMIQKTATTGGYALGSGNSIPDYVPVDNYLAMVRAVNR